VSEKPSSSKNLGRGRTRFPGGVFLIKLIKSTSTVFFSTYEGFLSKLLLGENNAMKEFLIDIREGTTNLLISVIL